MQASALLLRWGSYCWARNLLVLIIYFSLLLRCPLCFQASPQTQQRVFPGVWKPLFLRFPSWDGAPSLPPSSPFSSCIFFPTCFWRQWSPFLVAWCPLPAFRSCFVEFAQCWNVLLMNLREKVVSVSYSSAILGPPLKMNFSHIFISTLWNTIYLIIFNLCCYARKHLLDHHLLKFTAL